MALNVTNYTFDLDMVPNGFPPVAPASQGDVGRVFVVNLFWSGSAWTPNSGVTCQVRGKKPDGTVFDYSATISGSTATFSTTEQMTLISGNVKCELAFTSGSTKIATANFILLVEEGTYDPDAPSVSDITGIDTSAIADKAITKAKLAQAVQDQIDGNSTDIDALETRVDNIEDSLYLAIDNDGYISLG